MAMFSVYRTHDRTTVTVDLHATTVAAFSAAVQYLTQGVTHARHCMVARVVGKGANVSAVAIAPSGERFYFYPQAVPFESPIADM